MPVIQNDLHRKRITATKGFTFLEVLLVLAIVSITAAFSYPFFANLILKNAVTDTSNNLVSLFREAHSYATAGKYAGTTDNGWEVSYSSSAGTLSLLNPKTGTVYSTYKLAANISVSGFTNVTFYPPAGLPNSSQSVTISSSVKSETVTLNPEGVANVSD